MIFIFIDRNFNRSIIGTIKQAIYYITCTIMSIMVRQIFILSHILKCPLENPYIEFVTQLYAYLLCVVFELT